MSSSGSEVPAPVAPGAATRDNCAPDLNERDNVDSVLIVNAESGIGRVYG